LAAKPGALPTDLLQFRAGGHILGFSPDGVYLAGLDHALRVEFLGATSSGMPLVSGEAAEGIQVGASSSTRGNLWELAGAGGQSGAQPLTRATYRDLWPGISLTYDAADGGIAKSAYHLAPGADPAYIRLGYNVPVELDDDGALHFQLPSGRGWLAESPPMAWQEIEGEQVPVEVAFIVAENSRVGFRVGAYDPRYPLTIDPTYEWHTFYGSSGSDAGSSIAVDGSGSLYIVGTSGATWLGNDGASPLHPHSGKFDMTVVKLNSAGVYQWHTFYGSNEHEWGCGITVDGNGNVYVTGDSYWPWQGDGGTSPLHGFTGGRELMVVKLNSSGAYQWHTFYGSASNQYGRDIALDNTGNIYVSGYTEGSWLGEGGTSPLHSTSGQTDLAVLKLNNNGVYQWHTFYGGLLYDYGYGAAVDDLGNVYITGTSEGIWQGDGGVAPLHPHSGLEDIVALKLSGDGVYQWHTFYGAGNSDLGYDIALDRNGNVYLTGDSYYPWMGDGGTAPLHPPTGRREIVVIKLNSGGVYQWHTFYGSSSDDNARSIAVDDSGNIYIAGYSKATWQGDGEASPLHAYTGSDDFTVVKLDTNGRYQWHTFYGSGSNDWGYGITVTGGDVYATGVGGAWLGDGGTSPLRAHSGSDDMVVLNLADWRQLSIHKGGAGSGTVRTDPSGIDCGADCTETYDYGTVVTLTATADIGSTFTGWGGACSGSSPTCQVTMDGPKSVTATFTLNTYSLSVSQAGSGAGTVSSLPPGIMCGADCAETYDYGTVLTLTATADTGSTFTGWDGACSGADTCTVTMDEAKSATATFTLNTYALTVDKTGTGSGRVSSQPSGIDCGLDCFKTYDYGTVVTLTAMASTGSTFVGWSGACSGMGSCVVTMDGVKSVGATFNLNTYLLTVSKSGSGSGMISSQPEGIDCGIDCSATYSHDILVTLTAAADVGSTFTGWGGACSGTDTCTVTMDGARNVTATFTLNPHSLSVSKVGNGSGTVSSLPTGIDCGADCAETYDHGTVVTLTATADIGSTFTGWGGACSGSSSTCQVIMDGAKNVTASFTLNSYPLVVSQAGSGAGMVSSLPSGIACGADCTESYMYGTVVTLTATATTGSTFTGWGGACSGADTCTVMIDDAKSVTATFTLNTYVLMVDKTGTGSGTISSEPDGIACDADCAETYDYGAVVTLTATADVGSTFIGWGGACSGTGICKLTMDTARSVTATFTLNSYPLSVSHAGSGSGTVSSQPPGIACGADCAETYDYGAVVTLTAMANTGSTFVGWSGACSGMGSCMVTMDGVKSVGATFSLNTYLLMVNKSGSGSGMISSQPVGINCGDTCSAEFVYGTVVTLTAVADVGSAFAGWSEACYGLSDCVVTIDATKRVTVTFDLDGGSPSSHYVYLPLVSH
jgi:uncharacterized repeat protein (TIGR02543 family)